MLDLWRRCCPSPPYGADVRTPALASLLSSNVSAASPWYVLGGRGGTAWQLATVRAVAGAQRPSHAHLDGTCVREWRADWLRWRDDCGSCHQYLVRGLVARKLQVRRAAAAAVRTLGCELSTAP